MYRQVKMVLLDIRHLVIDSAQSALPHTHAEGQLFMVQSGLITANTQTGHWVMPPGCLGWIPPFTAHSASNQGKIRGISLYFDEAWSHQSMPPTITIIRLTPLLNALLNEIIALHRQSNDVSISYCDVLADIIRRVPAQSFFLPMPTEQRLIKLTQYLWHHPDEHIDLAAWSLQLGMAKRTLIRHFQQQTGLSIGQWQQQLRLLLALEKLAAGESVTQIALDLGYQSLSAFIAMFRRYMGSSPKVWSKMSS